MFFIINVLFHFITLNYMYISALAAPDTKKNDYTFQ